MSAKAPPPLPSVLTTDDLGLEQIGWWLPEDNRIQARQETHLLWCPVHRMYVGYEDEAHGHIKREAMPVFVWHDVRAARE